MTEHAAQHHDVRVMVRVRVTMTLMSSSRLLSAMYKAKAISDQRSNHRLITMMRWRARRRLRLFRHGLRYMIEPPGRGGTGTQGLLTLTATVTPMTPRLGLRLAGSTH